jgi:hypothetical protein
MPELDEDMRELDTLLRRAAERGAAQARPADFESVVRRARGRRRNLSAAGAAGLVASVAIGVAVVAGVRGGAAPDPQSGPAAGPGPSAGAGPSAAVSTGPSGELPPLGADKKVDPIDLKEAGKDPTLQSLITDVAVVAWTPEPGETVAEVRRSRNYMQFLSGDGIGSGMQPLLNDIGSLRSLFPSARTGDPAVLTADPLTMSELESAAELLSAVPGVGDARVVPLRGMWFQAEVQAEGVPGRDSEGPGPVISLPGIQGGSTWSEPGGAVGKVKYTANATYAGGGVDRNGLAEIKTVLARHWGASADDVTIAGRKIKPE